MAHWRECSLCEGKGTVDCEPCAGTGMDLGDEEAILEGIEEQATSCKYCLGDGEEECTGCFGEQGEWVE
jgi:DnaJ-class molecular chaperone